MKPFRLRTKGSLIIICLLIFPISCSRAQQGALSKKKDFVIHSKVLGEQISVTTYGKLKKASHVIYITDGQKWMENGLIEILDKFSIEEKLHGYLYVLVSSIDPLTDIDKRNTYFFCNDKYVKFFEQELVPKIEGSTGSRLKSPHRSLLGVSFGGLNAAYFSGKTNLFGNYALLSPITYPCDGAITSIAFSQNENLRIILTSGKNDAENYLPDLYHTYKSKGYNVEQLFTNGSHDFENWNGQLIKILNYLTQK